MSWAHDDGWRPIKTAPKDGTEFLAWFPSWYQGRGGIGVGLWSGRCWRAFGGWADEPTHWMPLPAPPVDAEVAP